MPVIKVNLEKKATSEQKRKIIRNISKRTHDLLGIPAEKISVLLSSFDDDEWGRAGALPNEKDFVKRSRLDKI